jgi:hypothetical protein
VLRRAVLVQRQQPSANAAVDVKVTLYPFPGYEVEVTGSGNGWTPVSGRQRPRLWAIRRIHRRHSRM